MERIIASVRANIGDRFEVLGEIAGDPRGGIVCLARDHGKGSLVALILTPTGAGLGGGGDYAVEVLAELGAAFVPIEAVCDVCGTPATQPSPTCSTCGMKLTSAEQFASSDRPTDEILHALREAAGASFEVLGAIPRAAGLAPLYFGRDTATGNVVPLSPRWRTDVAGGEVLAVDATQLIWMIEAARVESDRVSSPADRAPETGSAPPAMSESEDGPFTPPSAVPNSLVETSAAEPGNDAPEPAPIPPVALGPVFGRLPPEEMPPLDPDAHSELEDGHREAFEEILRGQATEPTIDVVSEPAMGGWEAPAKEELANADSALPAQTELDATVAAGVAASVPADSVAEEDPQIVSRVLERRDASPATRSSTPPLSTRPSSRTRRRASMLPIVAAVLAAVVVGFFTISSSGDVALVHTAPTDAAVTGDETATGMPTIEPAAPTEAGEPGSAGLPGSSPLVQEATLRIAGAIPETATVSVDGVVNSARTVVLTAGSHRVSLRADGYLPIDTVIVLEAGRTVAFAPEMRAMPAIDAATFVSAANALDLPLPPAAGDGASATTPVPGPSTREPLGTALGASPSATGRASTPPPLPAAATAPPVPVPAPPAAPEPPPSASPPAAATVAHEPLNLALHRFAAALESRAIENVAGAYPGMTQAERSTWMEFFGSVATLRVALANVQATPITGDIVQIPFTLIMEFSDRGGAERQLTQNYRATFIQRPEGWKIEAIRPN